MFANVANECKSMLQKVQVMVRVAARVKVRVMARVTGLRILVACKRELQLVAVLPTSRISLAEQFLERRLDARRQMQDCRVRLWRSSSILMLANTLQW